MNPKQKVCEWFSRYIRLRDAVEYARRTGQPIAYLAQCCTCDTTLPWNEMEAGHFIARGMGNGSGVSLDERNVHAQCHLCNTSYDQGTIRLRYRAFMLKRYGQKVIDELLLKHNQGSKYSHLELKELAKVYKRKFDELNEAA